MCLKKDNKLEHIERESNAQFDELVNCRSLLHSANDQISQKDEELRMLIFLNSKISKDFVDRHNRGDIQYIYIYISQKVL